MKILKYTVTGALQQSETGPEAQVGDQVTLYLDTVANPDFPEFIFGVIQPGIKKVGACSESTQYYIEYDEADLDGAQALLREGDVINVTTAAAIDVVAGDVLQVQENLDAEEAARIAADQVITTNLATEVNNRIADVNAEEARALAAEALLAPKNGATLTNVTITTGSTTTLLVSGSATGMESFNVATQNQVTEQAKLRIPILQNCATDPNGLTFLTLLLFPDGNNNPQTSNILYNGNYAITGTVNGKDAFAGGTLQGGTPRGKIEWNLSGYWALTSNIIGLALTEWRKTAANLTDNAPWVPQTTALGETTGDIIVRPQIFLPGQPIKPTDSNHKLAVQSTTSGSFHYVPLMGPSATAYADDAAAAAGGVLVGEYYKKTGGTVAWRQA